NYLTDEMNNSKGIKLSDGSLIDGRKMTVILISSGETYKDAIYGADFDTKVEEDLKPLDLTIGAPPTEGRARHARGNLDNKLAQLLVRLKTKRTKDFATMEKIELKGYEEEILKALVDFDRKITLEYREVMGTSNSKTLPLGPLDRAISALALEV